jgi:hypothetical protein
LRKTRNFAPGFIEAAEKAVGIVDIPQGKGLKRCVGTVIFGSRNFEMGRRLRWRLA